MAAVSKMYQMTCSIETVANQIFRELKESYGCQEPQDQTVFEGKDSFCRIDTYQIYAFTSRGYITVILCFFRPDLTKEGIMVKVTPLVPSITDSTAKSREIQKVIEKVILAAGGKPIDPVDSI